MKNGVSLRPHQTKALLEMRNGCILCGETGSGKSRTALAYYYILNGGRVNSETYVKLPKKPMDLYIITTAMKRDRHDWEGEMIPFLLSTGENKYYDHAVVVDSWNNISKYKNVKDSFFIFDEQRVVGSGSWVKTFLEIVKWNQWILLSATPGDKWEDYIPVFIANGFYTSRSDFARQHVIYSPYTTYPKIDRYVNEHKLIRQRESILIPMTFERTTVQCHHDIPVEYDRIGYKDLMKNRRDPETGEPFQNAGTLCFALRKVVNSDESRQVAVLQIAEDHPRVIVFYNFDYELDALRELYYGDDVTVAEWNGHKHEDIPDTEKWVYLVQYNSGAEGWNCTSTDTMIFYSQSYSYRVMVQASGRIDRMNTPFKELHYYHLISKAPIDISIRLALAKKKTFNARSFVDRRRAA